jgi:hypothetical protein
MERFGRLSHTSYPFVRAWWKQIERSAWSARLSNSSLQKAVRGFSSVFYEANDLIGENEDEGDTSVDRLIEALLRRLIPGCLAKDKTVRYRTMQLLAEIAKSVQSLPEEVYGAMHTALINSANDKDAAVRVQVVIVLGKLARGEDLSET